MEGGGSHWRKLSLISIHVYIDFESHLNVKLKRENGIHSFPCAAPVVGMQCINVAATSFTISILFTPAVLWVTRCVDRELKIISISEPLTAGATDPSMKQVSNS
jgi:hypothetical protein